MPIGRKIPFYNEKERKAFKCVIQYHREITRRFCNLPSVTKGMVHLELKGQTLAPSALMNLNEFLSSGGNAFLKAQVLETMRKNLNITTYLLKWLRTASLTLCLYLLITN